MIDALQVQDKWIAFYDDADGRRRNARDARGMPILCDTEALALSVAWYRRRRLLPLEG